MFLEQLCDCGIICFVVSVCVRVCVVFLFARPSFIYCKCVMHFLLMPSSSPISSHRVLHGVFGLSISSLELFCSMFIDRFAVILFYTTNETAKRIQTYSQDHMSEWLEHLYEPSSMLICSIVCVCMQYFHIFIWQKKKNISQLLRIQNMCTTSFSTFSLHFKTKLLLQFGNGAKKTHKRHNMRMFANFSASERKWKKKNAHTRNIFFNKLEFAMKKHGMFAI